MIDMEKEKKETLEEKLVSLTKAYNEEISREMVANFKDPGHRGDLTSVALAVLTNQIAANRAWIDVLIDKVSIATAERIENEREDRESDTTRT